MSLHFAGEIRRYDASSGHDLGAFATSAAANTVILVDGASSAAPGGEAGAEEEGEEEEGARANDWSIDTPVGLAAMPQPDGSTHVLAANYASNRVLRFGADGEPLGTLARGGGLRGPSNLYLGDGALLHVTSYDNHRLLTYNVSDYAAAELVEEVAAARRARAAALGGGAQW